MKLLNAVLLASVLTVSLSACLKDKSAEQAPAPDQTLEQPAEVPPTEAPADSGTTQSN